jgi:hypothetical protein
MTLLNSHIRLENSPGHWRALRQSMENKATELNASIRHMIEQLASA